ncbi:helix-turn-helix transcriptional regulator [Pseudorhodobacter sp. MZDSW-24AT]|uniref:helix-turn-helix transcriptional regulator n=1 Tax=Pseudorhodobacter sp. MZDSW-24AT TaxID=2052957 RepID=UPI000C1ED8AC|nr:helix-turn-helix transcriptional regulator [Pseudorhodobacter sp. MZDSW-24AT]PJF08974.1 LuxR family transcriptional regulator [Pseudorhodobacter sp. MZDSW-24AT]
MRRVAILALFVVQALCAFFFVSDILSSLLGLRSTPLAWELRELLEIGAALGLILGLILGALVLRRSFRDRARAEARLRRASGAFMDLLSERFDDWGLTPAERDVALFSIKGMSTAEIAGLRGTSEGTIKAQTNAIYRKAGVTGRPQLLSLFIEDLMRDDGAVRQAAKAPDAA